MLRSIAVAILALAVTSSAHATSFRQQEASYRMRKSAEDLARALKNRNDDLARRALRSNRADRAQRMNSPFVRATRLGSGWDARSLGLANRASTIHSGVSIYARLHTAPQSLVAQLSRSARGSSFRGLLLTSSEPVRATSFSLARLTSTGSSFFHVNAAPRRDGGSIFAALRASGS